MSSTVLPLKNGQSYDEKAASSSLNVLLPKILAGFFFVCTVALTIALGIVASDDSTDIVTTTTTTTVQTTQTTLVRVEKELTFGMASPPTITNIFTWLKTGFKQKSDGLINEKRPISFFELSPPYGNVVPLLSSGPIGAGDCVFGNNGLTCDYTVDLRTNLTWSDGEVIDADDVIYTKTLADLLSFEFPDVTKVNSSRVIVHIPTSTANQQPGYCAWFGSFTSRTILPHHYWSEKVNEVSDPSELLTIDETDMPHFSPYEFFYFERPTGTYITTATGRAVPQPEDTVISCRDGEKRNGTRMPYDIGTQTEDCVTYTTGPFFEFLTLNAYGSGDLLNQNFEQENSRENWLMHDINFERKYNDTVLDMYNASADYTVLESEVSGSQYMAFNMNEFPSSSKAFRQTVSCLFDKEALLASDTATFSNAFIENQFLSLSEWRTNTTNGALFDCENMTQDERRAYATGKLQGEGWTVDGSWTNFPLVNLTGPNNESLPLNHSAWNIMVSDSYELLRKRSAEQIAQDLTDFGIPINASIDAWSTISGKLFTGNMACYQWGATTANFFMAFGGRVYPDDLAVQTHLPWLYKSDQDLCLGGYYNWFHFSNTTFDGLDTQFKAANTLEDTIVFAKDQQDILQEELPNMNLFNTKQSDVFRNVILPFELNGVLINGYASLGGIPDLLKPVE